MLRKQLRETLLKESMARHETDELKGKNYTTTSYGKVIMIKTSKKELPAPELQPNVKLR